MSDDVKRTMDGSVFEGLFVRELRPTGAFSEDLKRIGFDVTRLEPRYPELVFLRAVEVAARHAYPEATLHEAHFFLGSRTIAGYFSTILGRVTATMIPVLGVASTLKRVTSLWTVAQPAMRISAERAPEGFIVSFENDALTADLVAGMLQEGLRRAERELTCAVLERRPGGGRVLVRAKT
ncbi:MAG: DUF2378 family protein [Myxococcota bacterium]